MDHTAEFPTFKMAMWAVLFVVSASLFGWRFVGTNIATGMTQEIGKDVVKELAAALTNPKLSSEDREFLRRQLKDLVEREQAEKEREAAHRRELQKMETQARLKGPNPAIGPRPREPVIVPRGSCVLDGDNLQCAPSMNTIWK